MRYVSEKDFIQAVRYVAEHPEDVEEVANSLDDGCPYITVTDKHGRLIDADALKDELLKCAYPAEREWYFAEVAQIIDEQPTVNEVSTDKPSNCNLCRYCDNGYCSYFDRLFGYDEMYCTVFEERG